MVRKEQFPGNFQNTTLHMIFKGGGGKRHILSDNRFVHTKLWFPRAVEACIVEEGLKGPLVGGSSIYQIGGQPGHRPEELVFVMKAVIARQISQRNPIIIQPSDIQKFFDKEIIEDIFLACEKRGANPKATRLWYKLNQDTRIRVRTGAGISDYTEVGAVVGQGTIGGALGSQAVLDEGVSANFVPGGQDELNYGSVPLGPLLFQDDLIHGTKGIREARQANICIDRVVKQLNLRLHKDKTSCIILGTKKQRQDIEAELRTDPLMCGDIEVKLKKQFKWLGQILSSDGLADSVRATISEREGKIRGASLEYHK